MIKSEFIDYKGHRQMQYDRALADTNEDMLALIKHKNRILTLRFDNHAISMTDFGALLKKGESIKILSVVNYDADGYTSVIIEQAEVA